MSCSERRGCERCNCLSYCMKWWTAYQVQICTKCKDQEKLISKSCAKLKYLLSDGDLSELGVICKDNPRHKDWNQMKLHLESQVRNVSYEKYGGELGLEYHRRQQSIAKLQKLKDRETTKRKRESRLVARMDNVKKRIEQDTQNLSQSTEQGLLNREDAEEI
eukprot:TRINITY_DN6753_c0_g1_i1.p1 TRINITY_DN6753_c0_g1~~TRINITY_DN6753_c0_g1_i1.p1  ORF type:complete len:162 (-),score=10.23 TRINITY_DN6753_c0_g1_i1:389-874(-)